VLCTGPRLERHDNLVETQSTNLETMGIERELVEKDFESTVVLREDLQTNLFDILNSEGMYDSD